MNHSLMKKLNKYSFGIGDRFTHQGVAQLRAIQKANQRGIDICPVWNKSHREHGYVGTTPHHTRKEADHAVKALDYKDSYFVDADHIHLGTVAQYVDSSDFFTLDVASFIGKGSSREDVNAFIHSCKKYTGELRIPGITEPFLVTEVQLHTIANTFLAAANQASEIYAYLVKEKGAGTFITEVSMDEVTSPQTPVELFFILKMLADRQVAVQTIAPKFNGRFNKGVDYAGDVHQFAKEFEEDLLVIDLAVKEFGLPEELKLSVHSGSDKFSIYPFMAKAIEKHDKGLHVKTAGTTWLEEVIGLAMGGEEGLELAKRIYDLSHHRQEELCAPYADVIDIDRSKLPLVQEVNRWSGEKFANTLRHVPNHPDYNANFRQLIHVAYVIAAEMGTRFTDLLVKYQDVISSCVEENLFERHLSRLFPRIQS